jgi:hypothetical protein
MKNFIKTIIMMVVLGMALGGFVGYAYKDQITDSVNRVAELRHERVVVINKENHALGMGIIKSNEDTEINLTTSEEARSTLIEEYFNEKEIEYIYGLLDDGEIVHFRMVDEEGVDWLVSCFTVEGVEWSIRDAQQQGDRLVISYD